MAQANIAGMDIVVIGKNPAAEQTKKELATALNRQWHKLIKKCKESSSP